MRWPAQSAAPKAQSLLATSTAAAPTQLPLALLTLALLLLMVAGMACGTARCSFWAMWPT